MSVRRLIVVAGVLLGLLVMHGLAPGHPSIDKPTTSPMSTAMAMPGMHHDGAVATPMSDAGTPMPGHRHEMRMGEMCVAVLGGFALWALLALVMTGFLPLSAQLTASSLLLSRRRRHPVYRPPSLSQLCVLRV